MVRIKNHPYWLLACLFYLTLTIWLAWPVLDNFTGKLWGVQNDALGGLWAFWWVKYAIFNLKQSPFYSDYLAFPFGINLLPILTNWNLFFGLLATKFWGPIAIHNLFTLTSIPLTGIAGYFLAWHFTKKFWPSLFAGLVITLSPYHIGQAKSFYHLAQTQWLILYLLFLFRTDEKRSSFNLAGLVISFVLTIFTVQYYAIFAILVTLIFYLLKYRKNIFQFKNLLPIISTILILLAIFVIVRLSQKGLSKQFSLDDVKRGSARAWYYFLPAQDHPLLRGWAAKIPGFSYSIQTIYLGFIPLFLSLIAIFTSIIGKIKKWHWPIIFFTSLALIAVILTIQPIPIGAKTLPTPSYLLYLIFPFVRILTRFAFLTTISLAILSAFTLTFWQEKIRSKILASFLILAVFVLLSFEYLPGRQNVDLSSTPSVYQWLKNQPKEAIVIEYPFYPINPWIWSPMFWQSYHEKKLVNSFSQSVHYSKINQVLSYVERIWIPEFVRYAQILSAKYLIVHTQDPDPIQQKTIAEQIKTEELEKNSSLKLLKDFSDSKIFQIKNPLATIYASATPVWIEGGIGALMPGTVRSDDKAIPWQEKNPLFFLTKDLPQNFDLSKIARIVSQRHFEAEEKSYLKKNDGWKIETNAAIGGDKMIYSDLVDQKRSSANAIYQFPIPLPGAYKLILNTLVDDGVAFLDFEISSGKKVYKGSWKKRGEIGQSWHFENIYLGPYELEEGFITFSLINQRKNFQPSSQNEFYNGKIGINFFRVEADFKKPTHLFLPAEMTFSQSNQNNYKVSIKGAQGPFFLVFIRPFDPRWKIKIDDKILKEENHFLANGFANSWYIEKKGDYKIEIRKF